MNSKKLGVGVMVWIACLTACGGRPPEKPESTQLEHQFLKAALTISSEMDGEFADTAMVAVLEVASNVHDLATIESMSGLSRTATFQFLVACGRARAAAAKGDEPAYDRHAARASALADQVWHETANHALIEMYADSGRIPEAQAILERMREAERTVYDCEVLKAIVARDNLDAADTFLAKHRCGTCIPKLAEAYMRTGAVQKAMRHVEQLENEAYKQNIYATLAQIHATNQGAPDTFDDLMGRAIDASPDLRASAFIAAGDIESAKTIAKESSAKNQVHSYLRMATTAKKQMPNEAAQWMELAYKVALDLGMNQLTHDADVWRLLGCWGDVDNARLWIDALDNRFYQVVAYCLAAEAAFESKQKRAKKPVASDVRDGQ